TGEGPAPEVVASELDRKGRTDYELIAAWYRKHKTENAQRYYDVAHDRLTPLFYKADRAMRESGFDPSSRFGPFSSEILDYNPVCLNVLLYRMERETEQILRIAGQERKAERWGRRAEERAAAINRLMWDPRAGLYFDYNFTHRSLRRYPFLTTFYPLWSGIASREQTVRVMSNLPKFERAGGLQTST